MKSCSWVFALDLAIHTVNSFIINMLNEVSCNCWRNEEVETFINDGYVMRGESHDDISCKSKRICSMTMEVRMPIELYNVELLML